MVGRVLLKPVLNTNSSIPKLVVELGFADMKQSVVFLGNKADVSLSVGDKLVLGGICVKEWRRERTLETGYTTMLEVNPPMRVGLEVMQEIGAQEPKRKALRISLPQSFTIAALQDLGNRMLQDASLITAQEFVITGTFDQMPESFFETDPPLIGDIPHEKMRWLTSLQDQSGEMGVTVWDKACFELFHMTASKLRDLWKDGHQNPSKRADLLELQRIHRGFLPMRGHCTNLVLRRTK